MTRETKVFSVYRIDLKEASKCDTEGCEKEVRYVDAVQLDSGDLLHSFRCETCTPISVGSVVS